MLCDRCNKDGAKPYKYNDGGSVHNVNLCDSCFDFLSNPQRGSQRQTSKTAEIAEGVAVPKKTILGMERRCPTCGKTLASIRKTGYIGCADCFRFFKAELVPVIDKLQNKIISAPEKKQREMSIILLEDEYTSLLTQNGRNPAEMNAISSRLRQIEEQLASMGVRVDE